MMMMMNDGKAIQSRTAQKTGVEETGDVTRRCRLRWNEHVKGKGATNCMKECSSWLEVRRRPGRTQRLPT